MATRMQQRRGTAAEWSAANPVLGNGEFGFTTDTKIIKMGDGTTAWNTLASISVDKARDADKLDGLDSTDVLRRGGTQAANTNHNTLGVATLNAQYRAGWYDATNATGAPDNSWWLVMVMAHSGGSHWQRQIAYDMNGGTARIMHRRCSGGDPTLPASWTAWERIDAAAFLGATAKAADSELLDGIDSTGFVRTTGSTLSGKVTITKAGAGAWGTTDHLELQGSTSTDIPKISFHVPTVSAQSVGMDSTGLRTFSQTGTLANFRAGELYDSGNRVYSSGNPPPATASFQPQIDDLTVLNWIGAF